MYPFIGPLLYKLSPKKLQALAETNLFETQVELIETNDYLSNVTCDIP